MKKKLDTSLYPSIFDKLTDDEPRKLTERKIKTISVDDYKNIVIRDILNLLNTTALKDIDESYIDNDIFMSSTLGYGIPPLSGVNIDDIEWESLQDKILKSIQNFEPRLIPDTISVNLVFSEEAKFHQGAMFEISGILALEELNHQIFLKTVMDTDSCMFKKLES